MKLEGRPPLELSYIATGVGECFASIVNVAYDAEGLPILRSLEEEGYGSTSIVVECYVREAGSSAHPKSMSLVLSDCQMFDVMKRVMDALHDANHAGEEAASSGAMTHVTWEDLVEGKPPSEHRPPPD